MTDRLQIVDTRGLELAGAVQAALLEGEAPHCQCGKVVLRNRMSEAVGGDFHDFRPLGQDQVAFVIGDVMGHGVGAALLMTLIVGLLRADRRDHRRPSQLVGSINEILVGLGRQLCNPVTCSLIYGVVDLPSGILLYVNAGHPEPIVCNRLDGRVHTLAPTTMLLGVQNGVLPESCHQFRQGDRVVLFTDGITEARQEQGLFGPERLTRIVQEHREAPAEQLAERILQEADGFAESDDPLDDQTVVVIDFDRVSQEA